MDFNGILGRFLKLFEKIWKTNNDQGDQGKVNGWRRPNHMRSPLDALQTPIPVDFRRFPRDFHSVAKQASFRVALWSDFSRFWSDFERFWEAKMDAKIDFLDVLLQVFFGRIFGIDFEWIFGGSKLEKSVKTNVFPKVFAKFHKNDVFEKVAKKHRF